MKFSEELARLSDAATQGKLSVEDFNADDLQRPNRFEGPVVVYADADCDTHPVADFSCNHTCRDAEEARANAALYKLLANRRREILVLVGAARQMSAVFAASDEQEAAVMRALSDALAALDRSIESGQQET